MYICRDLYICNLILQNNQTCLEVAVNRAQSAVVHWITKVKKVNMSNIDQVRGYTPYMHECKCLYVYPYNTYVLYSMIALD